MKVVMAEMPTRWLAERKNSDAAQWDEMWNGVLHMPPMPNRMHQNLARDLQFHLMTHWRPRTGGRVNQEVNLTTPADADQWTLNFRIPDLVLLDPPRFDIDKGTHMAGAPLVVVEVRSAGDETEEKLPFYAGLGVPEVWVIDRDQKSPEVFVQADGKYTRVSPDADGWHVSPATGVRLMAVGGKLRVRVGDDPATLADLPDD